MQRPATLDSSLENLQVLYETFLGQVNIEVTRGHNKKHGT